MSKLALSTITVLMAVTATGASAQAVQVQAPAAPQVRATPPAAPQVNVVRPAMPGVNVIPPAMPGVNMVPPVAPRVNVVPPAAPQMQVGVPSTPQVQFGVPQAAQMNMAVPQTQVGVGAPGVSWQSGQTAVQQGAFFPGPQVQTRVAQGGFVHPYWMGPQFHINDWQRYGFAAPGQNQRWVRYYNDAYLIDSGGHVIQAHNGLDWDRYGEAWGNQDGIPAYVGNGQFHPGGADYGWVDRYGGPWQGQNQAYGQQAYSQQGYGGYGGYGYPIIIETTVTGGYTEEIVEEVVSYRRAARPRRARPACHCTHRRAPSPPPAGERG